MRKKPYEKLKTIIIFSIILAGVLGLAKISQAATYYVSTLGVDTNPGTQVKPWRTIQKAADAMVAGDTVIVMAGDYSDQKVRVSKSGAAGAPITYQAQGKAKVKGFLVAALYGPNYDTENADFITIRGFEIVNTEDKVGDSRNGVGIFMEGSHCLIENNEIHYSTWGGIELYKQNGHVEVPEGCVVRNNLIYQNGMAGIEVSGRNNLIENNEIWGTLQHHPNNKTQPNASWLDADGMRFFGQGHIIRGNNIHDITYGVQGGNEALYGVNINPHIDCFQTWNNAEVTSNIIFEKNFCDEMVSQAAGENGHGFMLEGGANNLTIKNNIIKAYGGINAGGVHHLFVYNNLWINNLSFQQFYPMGIILENAPYSIVKNNIFYNQPDTTILISYDATGIEVDYNLAYNSDGSTPPCFQTVGWVCKNPPPAHDLWKIDPKFVNPGAGNFHLQSGSPAVDKGATLSQVTDDYDGNPRPQGSSYDIGAYEYVEAAPPPDTTPPASPTGLQVS